MFCINCFNSSTGVVNSRHNKKQPQVWRRRKCPKCSTIFTTYERPSLSENKPVFLPNGETEAFNLGKLILSISQAFTHSPKDAMYSSLHLAQSVEDILSSERETLSPEDIAAITHHTLRRFDEAAAMQYALRHSLITSTKKRGRPSLS